MRETIAQLVSSIVPGDATEEKDLAFVAEWIASGAEIFRIAKPNQPDTHLVAYFALFDSDSNQLLLVDHKKAQCWIPAGGHVEIDEHPQDTVKREIIEELGVEAEFLYESPLFLTVSKTAGPGSHTDVSLWYLLRGSAKDVYGYDSKEFHAIAWFKLDEIPFEKSDAQTKRFIHKLNKFFTRTSYEDFANAYAENTAGLHPYVECQKFIEMLPQQGRVLDVGCGPGRDIKIFEQHGLKVVGIDFSTQMIELARQNTQAELHVMDIERLEFPHESFDGVWASASFLHIPKQNLPNVLKTIHSCLKHEGIFFVSLKQGSGEMLSPDQRYENAQKFWSYFEKSELVEMLQQAEFEIVDCRISDKQSSYSTHPFIYVFCRKVSAESMNISKKRN